MSVRISNPDDPRLEHFIQTRPHILLKRNEFVAESEKVVLKHIDSGIPVKQILATPDFFSRHQEKISSLKNTELFEAELELLKDTIGAHLHKGVFSLGAIPPSRPIKDKTVFALNGLTSPENVGSIVRSLASFNYCDLIIDSKTLNPWVKRALRVSMGHLFSMNIIQVQDFEEEIKSLSRDRQILIAHRSKDSVTVDQVSPAKEKVIIIGSEGHGPDHDILDLPFTSCVEIPMSEKHDSLNAAIATAILAYEQRY